MSGGSLNSRRRKETLHCLTLAVVPPKNENKKIKRWNWNAKGEKVFAPVVLLPAEPLNRDWFLLGELFHIPPPVRGNTSPPLIGAQERSRQHLLSKPNYLVSTKREGDAAPWSDPHF